MTFDDKIEYTDPSSARTFNKPSRKLHEQLQACLALVEHLYDTSIGTVDDSTTGGLVPFVIPGYLENFELTNNNFINIRRRNYLRIPMGAFYCRTRTSDLSKFNFTCSNTNTDDSSIVVNRPNFEEGERQLADSCCFDLHDKGNDLRIEYDKEGNYKCSVEYYNYDQAGAAQEQKLVKVVREENSSPNFAKLFSSVDSIFNTTNENFLDIQTLEDVIDLTEYSLSGTYYLYYNSDNLTSQDDLMILSRSKKFFLDSNKDRSGVKLYKFELSEYNGTVSASSITSLLKNPYVWIPCNKNKITNILKTVS